MSLYIATIEEIRASMGITDTQDDAQLTILAEGLQARFDAACGRGFLYTQGVEQFFDGDVRHLYLARFPLDTVASIHVSTEQVWDADSLLTADSYRINKARGKILYGWNGLWHWPSGAGNIRVVYTGGVVKADGSFAPGVNEELALLRRALFMQLSYEWRNKETLGLSQVSAGGVSVGATPAVALALKGSTLLPEVQSMLAPLMRMV
jgi:hypothetical protein